jgi:hypothetical protein
MLRRLEVVRSLIATMEQAGSGGSSSTSSGVGSGGLRALGSMLARLRQQERDAASQLADTERRLAVLHFARQEWQAMLDLMRGACTTCMLALDYMLQPQPAHTSKHPQPCHNHTS